MILRPVKPEEKECLYELICELAVYEGKDLATLPLTKDNLSRFGFNERPYFYTEVAEVEGKLVAYALYFYTFSAHQGYPVLYLEDLYVKPAYRKQGIGSALMSRLAQHAREHYCCRMEWHVLDWNQEAIAFYHKLDTHLRKDLILVRLPCEIQTTTVH